MIPEHIHLVFKTHLDLGFTDLANAVYRRYMDDFIPGALRLARALRDDPTGERFVWTTGSWLIDQYLEQGTAEERRAMEAAIEAGDIVWHALPFTTHTELMDPGLFRFGLSISQRLDARFGRRTVAAKMTDVPGHTRGIVPLLAEAGVKLLHIGVNEASPMPEAPPVFVWRDEASGAELLVIYEGDYGGLVQIPGLPEALLLRMTGDNLGPPTPDAIHGVYRDLRERFPGARPAASTLDAFAAVLDTVRDQLPVVTSEIGDSWIHGGGTDPQKMRALRDLLRLRPAIAADPAVPEPAHFAFQNALLCAVEHTWGVDIKVHLRAYDTWTAEELAAARATPPFRVAEASWAEQRAYLEGAVGALADTPWQAQAEAALHPPAATRTPAGHLTAARRFSFGPFALALDAQSGALVHLQRQGDRRTWADAAHPLALFRYETFDAACYERFWREYIRNQDRADVVEWAHYDYTKPGIAGKAERIEPSPAALEAVYADQDAERLTLTAALHPPTLWSERYGAPPRLHLVYTLTDDPDQIDIELAWFDKPACRLPEALWLSFVPPVPGAQWRFEKLGQWIDPLDVVAGGNRSLHGVVDRVTCTSDGRLTLTTLDAPLVAPGAPALLRFTRALPEMDGGVHVNLFNNQWGTNFPMWNEGDARFRFRLRWDGG